MRIRTRKTEMKTRMRIGPVTIILTHLSIILYFICACVSLPSREKQVSDTLSSDTVIVSAAKEQLIETILNNADLIRFSKMNLVRKEFDTLYLFIGGSDVYEDAKMNIQQQGYSIKMLKDLDGFNSSERPCYVFKKLVISEDGKSADIFLTFDLTGAIAIGQLVYKNDKWVTAKDFFIGTQ